MEVNIGRPRLSRAESECLSRRTARQRLALPKRFANAFTLIELLVVIMIIAVLAGLSFPVFQSVQNSAKKTQAKNDLTQIVTAVNGFYTEYGRYPIATTVTTDAAATYGQVGNNSKVLFDDLRGKPFTGALNTRQVVFLSPAEDTNQDKPKGKIGRDGQFYDAWGSPYVIRMDADYDNQVVNPYDADTTAGPANIRQGILSWSLGKDQKGGSGAKTSADSKDDVISWQ